MFDLIIAGDAVRERIESSLRLDWAPQGRKAGPRAEVRPQPARDAERGLRRTVRRRPATEAR